MVKIFRASKFLQKAASMMIEPVTIIMPVSFCTGFFFIWKNQQPAAACLFTREADSTTVCKNERKFRFGPSPSLNREWRRRSPLEASTSRTANTAIRWQQSAWTEHGSGRRVRAGAYILRPGAGCCRPLSCSPIAS